MTAAIWIRGILEDDYGVQPTDMPGGCRVGLYQPGRIEKVQHRHPRGSTCRPIGDNQTFLSEMIASGEIDASTWDARAPSTFDGVHVKRMWPDFKTVEAEYYQRTQHISNHAPAIAIRKDFLDRYPWAAKSLFDALRRRQEALGVPS